MTEAEWLGVAHPEPMVRHVRATASERRMRLVAVACCRRFSDGTANPVVRDAVAAAEAFADGLATSEHLDTAYRAVSRLVGDLEDAEEKEPESPGWWADVARFWVALSACEAARPWRRREPGGGVADNTIRAINAACGVPLALTYAREAAGRYEEIERQERAVQQGVVRDVFGNPFRPVAADPSWRTSTAVALAQRMYDAGDFSAMPILADALQDAGCDNDDVLSHCRSPGPHVRGCWVVDLVLGKEE